MKRVLIVGSSKLPIPAVQGGAVPKLIEDFIKTNEQRRTVELVCLSCFNKDAKQKAKGYKETKFIWAVTPDSVKKMDGVICFMAKKVLHISRLLSLSYFFRILWFTSFVAKHLRDNEYDCLVFENSIPVLRAMKRFGNRKKYKNKYYLHMHTVPRHYYFSKKLIRSSNKVICVSKYVGDKIKEATGMKGENFEILYNCVDTSLFAPLNNIEILKSKEQNKIPADKKIVVFAGRLCKDKGVDQVIKAQMHLNENYMLLIVGSNFYKTSLKSKYEDELKSEARELKDRIIFTGYVDYDDMPRIYNCADVIVLPSMWDEPAGMTILEGMACEKPVITTVSGGIPEYTGKGNCVLLKRSEGLSARIAREIEKVCNEPKYSKKLAHNARRRAQCFSTDRYYDSILKIMGVMQ